MHSWPRSSPAASARRSQPGVSLFQLDPSDGSLQFIAGDINSYDPVTTTDGFSTPLYTDSVLYASLTAGDYYLAVADGSNTPSPFEGQPPGSFGLFDPNVQHSGQNGWSTGPYVLNVLVQPAPNPPHVVSTSPMQWGDPHSAPDATDRHVRRACERRATGLRDVPGGRRRPLSRRSTSRGPTGPSTSRASSRTTARPIRPRSSCSTRCPTAIISSTSPAPPD